jgi:hypothetical protein
MDHHARSCSSVIDMPHRRLYGAMIFFCNSKTAQLFYFMQDHKLLI